ncbi:MFS transporter [Agrobacterium sp. YIC 4121]|uniref:MFS transporter n=1 Tax=Agrobacterium sp. YIC 4121 TaxID=1923829 RepID=UPI00099003A8|nr:MFS transporter [Agrobacterium sp. YIC 4121]OOO28059.1 hypothetical protein BTE54_20245 [Agrobacterium sp. YIC 4121]
MSVLAEWKSLFLGGNFSKIVVLGGGIALHAINIFVGSTLMPSIVKDIGGVDLLAWNTTLYIVASILASVFVAHHPAGLGPRQVYAIGAASFAIGSLLCGTALHMESMLLGRFVQGFGAGILVAISYSMVRALFIESLWPRALALMSVVWGGATLLGPAIGGVMAAAELWRLSFWILLPAACSLFFIAWSVLPEEFAGSKDSPPPLLQIVLLSASIMLLSLAGTAAELNILIAGAFLLLGFISAAVIVWRENYSLAKLLPTGAFSMHSPLFILYLMMILISACQASEIYVPYFLQLLKKQQPLWAGYMVSTIAFGWMLGAICSAGLTGRKARIAVLVGPIVVFLSFVGLSIFLPVPRVAVDRNETVAIVVCLSGLGLGIGVCWPHLQSAVLSRALPREEDLTSASIPIIQQFASALGAAVAGLVVNFNGVSDVVNLNSLSNAAWWLYFTTSTVAALVVPLALFATRIVSPIKTSDPNGIKSLNKTSLDRTTNV